MSQVPGPGYWEGILGPPEGPGRGLGRGTPHPGNRPARGAGSPGLARGPWESERGGPRQAGPRLPVQGLHAGLPGTSGRAPRDPRRPPAARRSRARTPGTLATRRRRRWPVHGAPSPRRRREAAVRRGAAPGGSRRAPPALRSAARRLRRPPPLAVTWWPRLPTRPRALGWGGSGWGGGALRGRLGPALGPPPASGHLGARRGSRDAGQRPAGLSNLVTAQATWGQSLPRGDAERALRRKLLPD